MSTKFHGYPEILGTIQEAGHYFGVVRLERHGEQRCFRFGVSHDSYVALRRALETRPFDQMPGVRRRCFFRPSGYRLENGRAMMEVRIEEGKTGKDVDIEAPIDLVSNLKWFCELDDWGEAEHLAVPDPRLE